MCSLAHYCPPSSIPARAQQNILRVNSIAQQACAATNTTCKAKLSPGDYNPIPMRDWPFTTGEVKDSGCSKSFNNVAWVFPPRFDVPIKANNKCDSISVKSVKLFCMLVGYDKYFAGNAMMIKQFIAWPTDIYCSNMLTVMNLKLDALFDMQDMMVNVLTMFGLGTVVEDNASIKPT